MRLPVLLLTMAFGACASTSTTAPYQPEFVNDVSLEYGDLVEPPATIENPFPVWPTEYRERGIGGRVVARGIVGVDGLLCDVEIIRSDHEWMVPLLLEVLTKWRFEPATLNGDPVEVYYNIEQSFTFY